MTTNAEGSSATTPTVPEVDSESASPSQTPLEALDAALHSPVADETRDSMPERSWREYRSDLTAFGYWLDGRNWSDPALLGGYLRALESTGATFATIERRATSITKLVDILAGIGEMDPSVDPATHPTTQITLKAIRRRLGTDIGEARALSTESLIEVLRSIDDTTLTGRRDIAMLLVGWFGTLRVSQITGIRLEALSIDDNCIAMTLRDRRSHGESTAAVSIPRTPGSRWCPAAALETWLTALHAAAPETDVVWPRISDDDTLDAGTPPLEHAEVDSIIAQRVAAAGANHSADSVRPNEDDRQVDEASIMRNARLRSVPITTS